ncbi:hypothetical protein IU470_17535 [Nocardia abscessus]|uniref:Uncharacterized protein n=1 Tax=Nocardia abscessus TaxID=120957 RepID=A0ABS0C955_9NOCA|nr:hypothetical protein [Nocardia abscessus]MBF6226900.1 hypothetical protein [Nocardia abscessus]
MTNRTSPVSFASATARANARDRRVGLAAALWLAVLVAVVGTVGHRR